MVRWDVSTSGTRGTDAASPWGSDLCNLKEVAQKFGGCHMLARFIQNLPGIANDPFDMVK
jgi:hypothetical protein